VAKGGVFSTWDPRDTFKVFASLTHGHKSAAFVALRGGALVLQDAEPLVQGHRRLLQRGKRVTNG